MYKNLQYLLVQFLALIIFSKAIPHNPYCNISRCDPGVHTLCQFTGLEPGEECYTVIRTGLEQYERDMIVNLHNDLRSFVYKGNEVRGINGPFPKASFITTLQWDDELAEIAQTWAEQCKIGHDRCRHVNRFLLGQNYGYESAPVNPEAFRVESIIASWYKEVDSFRVDHIYEFNRIIAERENFARLSQMIWHFTFKIGCGAMRYMIETIGTFFVVCNYGPKGNYAGKSVYPVTQTLS